MSRVEAQVAERHESKPKGAPEAVCPSQKLRRRCPHPCGQCATNGSIPMRPCCFRLVPDHSHHICIECMEIAFSEDGRKEAAPAPPSWSSLAAPVLADLSAVE